MDIVYLNGEYLAADKAVVSVFDRGFLFADSVYEVIPFYRGVGFQLEQHLSRLEYSLAQLRIEAAMPWRQICEGLVERNGSGDLSVYLQITRGAAQGRNHAIDTKLAPTVFACCRPIHDNYSCSVDEIVPISVIVTEDLRWKRCDIKATTLLPNILAQQQAADAGAQEALLLREGDIQEGASSNFFIVEGEVIIAPPPSHSILSGTTAQLVERAARALSIEVRHESVDYTRLTSADELWITSSTRGLVPVTSIDQQRVNNGQVGKLWRTLYLELAAQHRALFSPA